MSLPPKLAALQTARLDFESESISMSSAIKGSGIQCLEVEIDKPVEELVKQVASVMEGVCSIPCRCS